MLNLIFKENTFTEDKELNDNIVERTNLEKKEDNELIEKTDEEMNENNSKGKKLNFY